MKLHWQTWETVTDGKLTTLNVWDDSGSSDADNNDNNGMVDAGEAGIFIL